MKKQIPFRGTATALVTPFKNDKVDTEALRRLVSWQIENGAAALVACGTTGEPATMTENEWRKALSTVVAEAAGRVPVIAGTGGNNTRETIRFARAARELGADAQLCVTPYYNKTTQDGLIAHYNAIADDGALPVILYNVPSRTGLCVSPQTAGALSRHPNIVAIKEASGDLALAGDMMCACGENLAFYSGSDEVTVPLMSLGGLGVISVVSNVAPRLTSQMTGLMLGGDTSAAAKAQLRLLPLIRALFSRVNPIPVKAALSLMGRCENSLRLPLVPMEGEALEGLKTEMTKLGVL